MYHIFSYFKNLKHISWKRVICILALFAGSTCFAIDDSEMMQNIVSFMNVVFAMITALLTPAVILAGWLLTPDWTMGDFFGLRPYFLNVWILVSNLVYIAFAMILLFLAVMQIFGGEDAEYTFKKKLPQFLVGILMVPFTWLIVSWTLSFANQATAAVLAIPMGAIAQLESGEGSKDKGIFHDKVIPTKFYISNKEKKKQIDCTTAGVTSGSKECISAAEFVAHNPSGPFFIMMIYAYDIFRIQSADLIKLNGKCDPKGVDAEECIKTLTDVVISFGTGLIVTFFFGILTIALCWVLLMRAFKLWIYVMFSPLFGLAFFSGKGWGEALASEGGSGESSGLSSVSFMGFFKLAMVPVMVSAVLAFGLLFVGVINETFGPGHLKEESSGSFCTPVEGYMVRYCITSDGKSAEGATSQLIIGSPKQDKSQEYVITFEFGDTFSGFLGPESTSVIKSAGNGLVDSIQSIFAHVLLTLISLVIIWMGVKTAVSYDEVTKVAFSPFAKMGDSVGHMIAHLPNHIPMPHPAFQALTPGGMSAMADSLRNAVDQSNFEKQKSMREMFASPGLAGLEAAAKGGAESLKQFNDKLADTSIRDRNTGTGINAQKLRLTSIVEGSNIENKQTIVNQIKGANSTSELSNIIDQHKLKEKIAGEDQQTTFKLIQESAQSSPTSPDVSTGGTSTVFSGVTVQNDDKIRGLKNGEKTISKITASDLNPDQLTALKNPENRRSLADNVPLDEKRKKLKELGFGIEGLQDTKVNELTQKLLSISL